MSTRQPLVWYLRGEEPDDIVNGWELRSRGYSWGYNVWILHRRSGRREFNFTSLSQARKFCLEHDG